MKISLIQQQCSNDKTSNRKKGLEAVETAAKLGAKIICFAELAFEPFYPQEHSTNGKLELAESIPGPTTDMFSELAAKLGVVIILNLFERDKNRTYDSSPVIDSDGTLLGTTRMIHITDYPGFYEQSYYYPGDHGAPVYETKFGKIGVAICYDRHYPEYMRALALDGAEIVFVPQAGAIDEWPNGLYEAEMQVAAFQNGYFTALCNRVGKEPVLTFSGESFVCNPKGEVIAQAPKSKEYILICDVDLKQTESSHARRLFFRDRRPDLYKGWLTK